MARIINLRYSGRCVVCGARLRKGARAVFNGKGRGVQCLDHESGLVACDDSPGARASAADPYGFYTRDGRKIGSSCGCIDYPCCGH